MAKKISTRFFVFSALVLFLSAPLKTAAAIGVNRPVGGKVLTMLPITCPGGIEVFSIRPFGIAPPGPYYISAATKRKRYFTVAPGKFILGLYNPKTVICATDTVPPVSVPTFRITMFGSSLF